MAKSLRQAINDKCRECIFDPLSGLGNWRQQVSACTSPGCPLFPVRPVSQPKKGQREAEKAPDEPQMGRTTL